MSLLERFGREVRRVTFTSSQKSHIGHSFHLTANKATMGDVFKSVNELFFVSQKGQGDDSSSEVDDGDHSEANTAAEVERVRNLVSDEAFRVRFGRMLVFLTLLGTGTIVCLLVYAVLLFQNESNIQGEVSALQNLTFRLCGFIH